MNPLKNFERELAALAALEGLLTIAFFIALVWSVWWSIKAFERWERREEAKIKALQRIAAKLDKPTATPSIDDMRAD